LNVDINNDIQLYNDIEKTSYAISDEILVSLDLFQIILQKKLKLKQFLRKFLKLANYFKIRKLVIAS
jgi:hypothetical protein